MIKILIIGYGSIGEKHHKILKSKNYKKIKILTSRKNKNLDIIDKNNIKYFNPDYVIISCHTSKHFEYLKFINNNFSRIKILVEKPLFDKIYNFKEKNLNKIFVDYNLRLHPVINFIKDYIANKKLIFSSMSCFSNLKNWRKNILYSESNTAKKKFGGGALLELSHEIDLANYLFGIKKIHSYFNSKLSKLKINTDDTLLLILICRKIKLCNLQINFYDQMEDRKIRIVTDETTIVGDLINNSIIIYSGDKTITKKFKVNLNYTYNSIHNSIINNNFKKICNLKDGLEILKIISKIKNRYK